jgi:hypothetical protein
VKKKEQHKARYVSGYFEHPEDLVAAVKEIRTREVPIEDIFAPFPIHGLDELAGMRKSRIPTVGFVSGLIGGIFAFVFMTWVFTVDYPMIIGGKPYFSVPSFIPITFEVTILFAAFAMVIAFLVRSRLGPGARNRIYDEKVTDNHFVVLLSGISDTATESARKALLETGAMDVKIIDE